MIDIQALSWQAARIAETSDLGQWTVRRDEAFAALILEAAAVECDALWQEDGTAMQCRDAIRAMKPGKQT